MLSRLSSLHHSLRNECTLLIHLLERHDSQTRAPIGTEGWGGATLIYSYARRLGSFFFGGGGGGVQIVNFSLYIYILGGVRKINIFGDVKIF